MNQFILWLQELNPKQSSFFPWLEYLIKSSQLLFPFFIFFLLKSVFSVIVESTYRLLLGYRLRSWHWNRHLFLFVWILIMMMQILKMITFWFMDVIDNILGFFFYQILPLLKPTFLIVVVDRTIRLIWVEFANKIVCLFRGCSDAVK